MEIYSLSVQAYGRASISLNGGEGTFVSINLSEEDTNELKAVAMRLFEKRQQELAKKIADMKPEALPAPGIIEAGYDEVPF